MSKKTATAEITENMREAAAEAGLVYADDGKPGIGRRRHGKTFRYFTAQGKAVSDDATLERIAKLVIPPAWEDVWICASPRGHIQATGRDAKGRKQYKYHAEFRQVRESAKFEHMIDFAKALPKIRQRVDADMRKHGLPREKVMATIIYLLEHTLIRVGNDAYAKDNKSYGLTTLRNAHVDIAGSQLRFAFKGKSGKLWNLKLKDRRVAKIVRSCQELPGQELFEYVDDAGERRDVTSSGVNDYLKEISDQDITAKDFRTWMGTVLAALALQEFEKVDSETAAKKNVRRAIESVAARLGNTVAICRKCYVHPEIVGGYMNGDLALHVKKRIDRELKNISALSAEETAVLAFLRSKLA